jgi:hypothetical protein
MAHATDIAVEKDFTNNKKIRLQNAKMVKTSGKDKENQELSEVA